MGMEWAIMQDLGDMVRVSPTTWKHDGKIKLPLGPAPLNFLISSTSGNSGDLNLPPDEINSFLSSAKNIEIEREVKYYNADPCPSLWIGFTIDLESTMTGLDALLEQHGTTRDPEDFSALLNQLRNSPRLLGYCGDWFDRKFRVSGSVADHSMAISAYELDVCLTPIDDERYLGCVLRAVWAVLTQFNLSDDHAQMLEIHVAEARLQAAIFPLPRGNPYLPALISALGASLDCRFRGTGEVLADPESAIRAVEFIPLDYLKVPANFHNLEDFLAARSTGARNVMEVKPVFPFQPVELSTEGHPNIPLFLTALGNSFHSNQAGVLAETENTISDLQHEVECIPQTDAIMPARLHKLGRLFHSQFRRTGGVADIESAVFRLQRAVELTSPEDVDLPIRLNHLGNSFGSRFICTWNIADINQAISNHQRAIELTPQGHKDLPFFLNNLGESLKLHFIQTGNVEDIDKAISNLLQAVELTPAGDVNLSARLCTTGSALDSRFIRTRDVLDIESSISHLQRAVELTSQGHIDVPLLLVILGSSFGSRFRRTGDVADIERALSHLHHAVKLTPRGIVSMSPQIGLGKSSDPHINHPSTNVSSAIYSFQSAIELLQPEPTIGNPYTQNIKHLEQSISYYRLAALDLVGARSLINQPWTTLSRSVGRVDTMDAWGLSIELLSHISGQEETAYIRRQELITRSRLATIGAAAAFQAGNIETALEMIEQNRCLVWVQLEQLRTSVDELRVQNPHLTHRFQRVVHGLDKFTSLHETENLKAFSQETTAQMITVQDQIQQNMELAQDWPRLIDEIRLLPDFHDFLRPPIASKLLTGLPLDGTVVIFNISTEPQPRCDALALISSADSPLHIPLPTFSYQKAMDLHNSLRGYLSGQHLRMWEVEGGLIQRSTRPKSEKKGKQVAIIYDVLCELWEHVLKPVLAKLNILGDNLPEKSTRPRIWWCPTGPLSFLPIHAAGIYDSEQTRDRLLCTSDFVISSYTPTISALLNRLKSANSVVNSPATRMLLISQPNTPGLPYIPGTKKEVEGMMDEGHVECLLLENAATTTRVIEEMKTCNWVHFACHANQDQVNPLKSGVQLHDRRLNLLEMMKLHMPHADHAFLSACQTSTGDAERSDEAIYIAAGMLTLGYRGVVATMWSIKDATGPEVAEIFYRHILNARCGGSRSGHLDSSRAAYALDESIQNIRKKVGDTEKGLLTWIPYIHLGI
ncbi:hypothetical protein GALMADRAFT_1031742 [Galerina marginata CBS 339.88]|uniref:CHAT domain-containing protein n=1 Tax=Galerina marginata (strain CBS 339.88) TaxID=685588 RepID=A0A067SD46_GALM3|nr:hypothetical protein GALMADRAFT_1031742 [Galerina marginata CBS 339.88]